VVLAACGVAAVLALVLVLVWVLGAPSAIAEADGGQGTEQFFGAIAYSPSTRAHGWAFDYTSRVDAEKRAMAKCQRHANDCFVPVWFRNACGALAIGFDGYGTGWGASRRLAENYALQSCRRYSGGCWVVRWVCTSK
jgi:serine/threonine-protein kinase